MLKKMFATFPKNVDEEILTIVQKSINKKKVKTRGFWDLNMLSGLFLGFVGFYSLLAYPP
jgi:hypothetical protein